MKKINILIILVSTLFMVSCESTTYDDISVPVTNPTYTANVAPIIKANCTGCHSSNGQYPALVNYNNVKDAVKNGNVLCRIDTQSCGSVMPVSGKMPQRTIDMIKLWATNGYIN